MKMEQKTVKNNLYYTEFSNLLIVNGFPLHELDVNANASVIAFRNLDINSGLCIGFKILLINHEVSSVEITNGC